MSTVSTAGAAVYDHWDIRGKSCPSILLYSALYYSILILLIYSFAHVFVHQKVSVNLLIHLIVYLLICYFFCVRVRARTGANWIGEYNLITRSYDSINMTNIANSLQVVRSLVQLHKDDPVVVGMTPGKCVRTHACIQICSYGYPNL